jgi:hypothetical protein
MVNKGTEAKTLAEKDAERAEKMVKDAQRREWRRKIKEEVEDMELNIKHYFYQMQLAEVHQRWVAWQDMLNGNKEKNPTVSSEVTEETPIVEMK